MGLAGVEIAVGGEHHLGRDLAEPVEHALNAEIGRAGGPDGPEARRRQHRRHRLRHVGHEARDPVAGNDAGRLHRLGEARDEIVELAMAEAPADLVLAAEDDGVAVVAPAQQVLGVVEPGLGEELRARHLARVLDADGAGPLADHAREGPELAPEGFRLGDRPAIEGGHVGLAGFAAEAGEDRVGDALGARPPERLAHRGLASSNSRIRSGDQTEPAPAWQASCGRCPALRNGRRVLI